MSEYSEGEVGQELALSLTGEEHHHLLEVAGMLDAGVAGRIAATPSGEPIWVSKWEFLELLGFLGAEVVLSSNPTRSPVFLGLLKRLEGLN